MTFATGLTLMNFRRFFVAEAKIVEAEKACRTPQKKSRRRRNRGKRDGTDKKNVKAKKYLEENIELVDQVIDFRFCPATFYLTIKKHCQQMSNKIPIRLGKYIIMSNNKTT